MCKSALTFNIACSNDYIEVCSLSLANNQANAVPTCNYTEKSIIVTILFGRMVYGTYCGSMVGREDVANQFKTVRGSTGSVITLLLTLQAL